MIHQIFPHIPIHSPYPYTMSEVDLYESYEDEDLDQLLRNVQLVEPESNDSDDVK